jgi:twinkle protein
MSRYKRNKNVHVFLVAHPTKMGKDKDGEVMIPSLMDISGSGHFYNKTDGGITIHRDFPNDTVRVFVNKVKFKHLGRIGDTVMLYNLKSGRYQDKVEVERDGWDDSNWLNREEQLTVRHFNETDAKELSQVGIMPRDEDDDLPF